VRLHSPRLRHDRTAHIAVDTRLCVACGTCVDACPREVLGMIALLRHRHVHVDHADRCRGCLKCVRSCQNGAIQPAPCPAAAA